MQEQPDHRSGLSGFRSRPIVVAIVAYFALVAILLVLAGLAYRPLLARFYYSRGFTSNQQRQFDKAIADYDEAIRLDPRYADAYFARAFAWNEKKQFDKAIADYTEAIRLNPKNADAYVNRGSIHNVMNDHDKAIADYSKAIRLHRKGAQIYSARGMIWAKKHLYDKAIADYDAAIRLNPTVASVYDHRGFAHTQMHEHQKALADYTEASRLASNDAFAHISIAWILANCPDHRLRDGERAVASATRGCELSAWKVPGYLETLASAYAQKGDFESAVKWQTTANALHTEAQRKTAGEQRLRYFQNSKWDDKVDEEL
jgi:tetratricopeptide (TPR) repeat protein